MKTKKFYVIASTEYEANMPDIFVMDEDGNYYGASEHSYAVWHNFPKSIDHWNGREGSDAGRFFNIDCVELTQSQVDEFERVTREHARLVAETPSFERKFPASEDYKTKKAYNQAVNDYMAANEEWRKRVNLASFMTAKGEIWQRRIKLFVTFSQKVYEAIKDNDNIKYA